MTKASSSGMLCETATIRRAYKRLSATSRVRAGALKKTNLAVLVRLQALVQAAARKQKVVDERVMRRILHGTPDLRGRVAAVAFAVTTKKRKRSASEGV